MNKITIQKQQRQVFVSYHFTKLESPIVNGFGNAVLMFDTESYADQMEKFVQHLERHLINQLTEQLGFKVQVKVLFFR